MHLIVLQSVPKRPITRGGLTEASDDDDDDDNSKCNKKKSETLSIPRSSSPLSKDILISEHECGQKSIANGLSSDCRRHK